MKIVLYSDDSISSKAAKKFLLKHELEFEDVNTKAPEGACRLRKRTQQNQIPAFEIKKSHGIHVVAGFDNFAIGVLMKELGLKEPINQKTLA
ncbi:hypothetical protein HY993_03580 [Candidatus Micrarchaeota archaeon]|nr:hypothetical protein [Candidatus Micrarchaeota archaeon]